MKQLVGLLLLLFLSSSCTAIFNSRNSNIKFKSNEAARFVVEGDTIQASANQAILVAVENSRQPLEVVVSGETKEKNLRIRSFKPIYYWGNFAVYGLGFIVDEIVQKKFIYPKKIYVDFTDSIATYLPYFPMEASLISAKNKLSISPVSLIGEIHPGIEVSYQRLFGDDIAAQISINKFISKDNEYARDARGFRLNLEGKKYFRNQEKNRFYSSFNIEYLRKDHQADFDVWVPDNNDDFYDDVFFIQRFSIEKRFITMTPRIGFEHYITDKLVLDAFFGIGVRYRETRVLDVDPALDLSQGGWGWFEIPYHSNRPRSSMSINFDMNFKIGWVF